MTLRITNARSFALFSAVLALCFARSLFALDAPAANKFEKAILAFEAADKKEAPPADAILFVGASQFTKWKTMQQDLREYTVINRGFGGSQMSDLVYFAERVVIPYKPKLIVTQEGGNDIHANKSPEQVLADYKAFVAKIRAALPDVKIVFSGLTPSPARWTEAEKEKATNALIKAYAKSEKNLAFIDMFDAYLDDKGMPKEECFVKDRLHHTPEGYKIRIALTKPFLKGLEK